MHAIIRVSAVMALSCAALLAQRVDARNHYERVFVTLPMVGKGTFEDPKRPMFAPVPSQMKPGDRSGIIAWHYEASDDGKTALVEFVFATRNVLTSTLSSLTAAAPGARSFQKGKDTPTDIEKSFQALKKGFKLDQFMVRVP